MEKTGDELLSLNRRYLDATGKAEGYTGSLTADLADLLTVPVKLIYGQSAADEDVREQMCGSLQLRYRFVPFVTENASASVIANLPGHAYMRRTVTSFTQLDEALDTKDGGLKTVLATFGKPGQFVDFQGANRDLSLRGLTVINVDRNVNGYTKATGQAGSEFALRGIEAGPLL